MLNEIFNQIKIALILIFLLIMLTGVMYPLIITGITQIFFPWQANGSLITSNGKIIGSIWIGQSFTEAQYFWGRPSVTTPFPYNSANSSGSNLGPSNPFLLAQVKARIDSLHKVDMQNNQSIPIDLVTASGSGLDPEISPEAAFYQVPRIAKARHLAESTIHTMILQTIKKRTLGFLGEPRVNVLQLNLLLDSNPNNLVVLDDRSNHD